MISLLTVETLGKRVGRRIRVEAVPILPTFKPGHRRTVSSKIDVTDDEN
jgi:hypothetical protein